MAAWPFLEQGFVQLLHHKRQESGNPRALDGAGQLPLMPRTHPGTTSRNDFRVG